jgi:hypothetical protein
MPSFITSPPLIRVENLEAYLRDLKLARRSTCYVFADVTMVNCKANSIVKSIWVLWNAEDRFFSPRLKNSNARSLNRDAAAKSIELIFEPIEEPQVIRRILGHLGVPTEVPAALPSRAPPISFGPFGSQAQDDLPLPEIRPRESPQPDSTRIRRSTLLGIRRRVSMFVDKPRRVDRSSALCIREAWRIIGWGAAVPADVARSPIRDDRLTGPEALHRSYRHLL